MTVPGTCRVEPVERLPRTKYPLAHRSGIEMLGYILAADQHWRPLSRRCKEVIRSAYVCALADAEARGLESIPLPVLPDGIHPATVRALTRRGLAADGRLSGLAVEVYRHVAGLDEHRKRPPTTEPVGGRL